MNAGTCWGKNTIDPRGRGVEKPRKKAPLTFCLHDSEDTNSGWKNIEEKIKKLS
jgi:hypothetical protein